MERPGRFWLHATIYPHAERYGGVRERRRFHASNHRLLRAGHPLCSRLLSAEVRRTASMLENIILILIIVFLLSYLLFALLKPEKF